MALSNWTRTGRRGSLQLDSEPLDGLKRSRKGSAVSLKLPLLGTPGLAAREEGSKVLKQEKTTARVEPRSVPANGLLYAGRRASFNSAGSDDLPNPPIISIKPSKGVKCFYQSNPVSPAPSAPSQPSNSKGFAEISAHYRAADSKVMRRMSTGSMELEQKQAGVLGVLADRLGIVGSYQKLGEKVYTALINPVPQSPLTPLQLDPPTDLETGTFLDPSQYSSSSPAEIKNKLRAHCQWIRKGEQGFLQGKKSPQR